MNASRISASAFLVVGLLAGPASTVNIETVPVGNPGNAGEMSGQAAGGYGPSRVCGAVGSAYRIGKFEVTTGQYAAFLNAVAAHGDSHGLYNPQMSAHDQGCGIGRAGLGTVGDPYMYSVSADRSRRPVNFVSWYDAARFCNWLTGGGTETGSYDLTSGDTMAVTRSSGAVYALPSEDEWYKAAFYNAAGSDYYLFPTRSNTAPSNDLATPDPGNSANFRASDDDYTLGAPFWMTEVGAFTNSESPYGTYDQAGNVWEWTEEPWDEVARVVRGGSFANTWNDHLMARHRGRLAATDEHAISGFRVVQVPEPAALALDILPDSCPNDFTINLQSKGRLPMAILGTDSFDVSQIDVNTISIGGVVFPVKTPAIEDVSAPAGEEECACQIGTDGYPDLVLHFSRRDVIQALGLDTMASGTVVPITVEGQLLDGTPFEATDCVTLVGRK